MILFKYHTILCHGAHTAGRNEDHGEEDKLKYTVFNKIQQGKTRQGWDTQEHRTDITPGWAHWRPLRTDTGEASRTDQGTPEPWRGRELWRPWRGVFVALASPLGPATTAGALLSPKKKILGGTYGAELRNSSPPWAKLRNRAIHRNRRPPWAKLGIWGPLRVISGTASISATDESPWTRQD